MDEMEIFIALNDMVEAYQRSEQIFNKLDKSSPSEQEKQLLALDAISKATRETRFFINEKGYVPSKELSELWYAAFRSTLQMKAFKNDDFFQLLNEKSKFWQNPKSWFMNPVAMTLVPKLLTIEEKCDFLIKEITNSQNEQESPH